MSDFVRVMMGSNMIDTKTTTAQVASMINKAGEVLLVLNKTSNTDQQCAATALLLALNQAGKPARLVCPQLPPSDGMITGLDQVMTELGHQNLQIAFDYNEDRVDKISYHIGEETKKFYLTIKPKKGAQPLDSSGVIFSYTGAEADLIITIGVTDLEDLGAIYLGYEELFRNKQLVSINEYETSFGTVKLTQAGFSSISEVVAHLIIQSGLAHSADSASNLLLGIESSTKGLQAINVSADTFQTVTDLMRAGAARRYSATKPTSVQIASSKPVDSATVKPIVQVSNSKKETTVSVSKK